MWGIAKPKRVPTEVAFMTRKMVGAHSSNGLVVTDNAVCVPVLNRNSRSYTLNVFDRSLEPVRTINLETSFTCVCVDANMDVFMLLGVSMVWVFKAPDYNGHAWITEQHKIGWASHMAVDMRENLLYITDISLHKVWILEKDGSYVSKFGHHGTRAGQLFFPDMIAVSAHSGEICVHDREKRVQVPVQIRSFAVPDLFRRCSRKLACSFA